MQKNESALIYIAVSRLTKCGKNRVGRNGKYLTESRLSDSNLDLKRGNTTVVISAISLGAKFRGNNPQASQHCCVVGL